MTLTTETTTTVESLAIPPPSFAGCSQVVLYSDGSESIFTVVLYDQTADEYTTETVSIGTADNVYTSTQPTFGSGVPGVTGYGYEQGTEFEAGLKVVGVVDYGGTDYVNPNFNLDTGNCGGSGGGGVSGEPFDWSTVLPADLPADLLADVEVPTQMQGLSLAGLVVAAGLVLRRTRERR